MLRVVRYGADYLNPGYRKNKGKSAPNAPYALSPNSSPDSRFPIPDSRFPITYPLFPPHSQPNQ
ncbi:MULTISPECIES: hypothetical protein [Moorena]|uniref:hypothetical protein n=1 Tax=Moorena TaxID=1155738 RepID=UPI0013BE46A7|nr:MULTISPECIES: hypothetical protein [Moorena]NEP65093.1 hypothetical protein [Moorena sp. SIO3A5]NEQ04873.1 hypothetical protein [Moorena sp. SIO4E2]NER90563.1 hypothetical protein [Moorena sp. SIO3A2]NET67229.1 hypothetical protein [Moorena sp. SIO1G6]